MKKGWIMVMAAALMLSGCGKDTSGTEGSIRNDVSAQTLVEAVAEELGDEYWADMELPPEIMSEGYGVSEEMYEEFYGQAPMISVNVDTLIVVKAKEGCAEDVQNAFAAYKETMVQDSMQYPINIPKIQASSIETFGNYVCFVQLGGTMNDEADDQEAMVKACQEMNEQALAVIEKELTK